MTTLKDVRDEIIDTLQDSNFSNTWIDTKINECLTFCANQILLPKLESSGEFETVVGTLYVDIPDSWNYSRNLYAAEVENASEIIILSSFSLLLREYPDAETELQTGDIEFIVELPTQLVYYPIPTSITTVKTKFYKGFTKLTEDDSIITVIPEAQVMELLTSYVKWKAYDKTEDGAEGGEGGGKPNMTSNRKSFWTAFNLLDESFPIGQSNPEPYRKTGWI